jgi:hypothetical protein
MVVELSDGGIVNVKRNAEANGYTARDKNHIYLGELERAESDEVGISVERYGAVPDKPVRVRLINQGGKLLVSVEGAEARLIDSSSEIKLKEGEYHARPDSEVVNADIDMSELAPFEGKNYGRLFGFRSSVRSGYRETFKKSKRAGRALRRVMCLFSAVIVFMAAVLGTSISNIKTASENYNHNVFYMYTTEEVSARLNSAVGVPESAIDSLRITNNYTTGGATIRVNPGYFESFDVGYYSSDFATNAVMLSLDVVNDKPLLAGRRDGLLPEEILISDAVADKLIEKSTLMYIEEYDDLIGLIAPSYNVGGKSLRIAGVVKSGEPAFYLGDLSIAKFSLSDGNESIGLASDFGIAEKHGEITVLIYQINDQKLVPAPGDPILVRGEKYTVSRVIKHAQSYDDYLKLCGIEKQMRDEFVGTDYEYEAYYYSEIDSYVAQSKYFPVYDYYMWLAGERGIDGAKYFFTGELYYYVDSFRNEKGRMPENEKELEEYSQGLVPFDMLIKDSESYYEEFNLAQNERGHFSTKVLLGEQDYVNIAPKLGKSHPVAYNKFSSNQAIGFTDDGLMYLDTSEEEEKGYRLRYTVIHSQDPEKTAEWINATFPELTHPIDDMVAIYTPDMIFDNLMQSYYAGIATAFVTMAVTAALMSVCMYFIMRSSLMGRVKEIGMLRAIGVSKKNLIYRFAVESGVLSVLTVMLGYLISSAAVRVLINSSQLIEQVMYYPVWMSLTVMVLLFLISVICGILPIVMLLRRSPSEILAKYDI